MKWAQIVVPSTFQERVKKLQEAGGFKASWRVLDRALDYLEREIMSREAFVKGFHKLAIEHNIREVPSNAFALVGWLWDILTTTYLTEAEKQELIAEVLNFITTELSPRMKEHKKKNLLENLQE